MEGVSPDKTKSTYRLQAEAYDRQRSRTFFEARWLARFGDALPRGSKVLDLGCGGGAAGFRLADRGETGGLPFPRAFGRTDRTHRLRVSGHRAASEILALGCELMKVIAVVAVALWNTVVTNLTQHFSVADWLQRSPGQFRWRAHDRSRIKNAIKHARWAAYAELSQAEKAELDRKANPDGWHPKTPHVARVKRRQERIPVSDGQVIAELALGFWKGLYGQKNQHALCRPTLKRTFPNRGVSRSGVASQLEIVYQSRNRLAHHEPVLHKRFRETVGAIEFVIRELGTLPEEDEGPLSRLLRDDLARVALSGNELSKRLYAIGR